MENNNVQNNTQKPRKLARHFWPWPLLIGIGIVLAGQMLGLFITAPFRVMMELPPMWMFTVQYFSTIGTVIVVWAYCVFFDRSILKSFKPASKDGLKGNKISEFLIGLVIGFVMNGGCILAAWLHGDLHFSVGKFLPIYLIVTFVCVCIQSSSEEMVCRGYIYHAHIDRYPAWVAIISNSLLFGALHLLNPGITVISFLQIAICGLAFSLIVYARKSLWMAYAIHTAWNFTQSILFGLPNSGIVSEGSFLHLEAASGSFWYDPAFGIEGTIPSVIMELLLCAWAIWCIKRNKDKEKKAAGTAA